MGLTRLIIHYNEQGKKCSDTFEYFFFIVFISTSIVQFHNCLICLLLSEKYYGTQEGSTYNFSDNFCYKGQKLNRLSLLQKLAIHSHDFHLWLTGFSTKSLVCYLLHHTLTIYSTYAFCFIWITNILKY